MGGPLQVCREVFAFKSCMRCATGCVCLSCMVDIKLIRLDILLSGNPKLNKIL